MQLNLLVINEIDIVTFPLKPPVIHENKKLLQSKNYCSLKHYNSQKLIFHSCVYYK